MSQELWKGFMCCYLQARTILVKFYSPCLLMEPVCVCVCVFICVLNFPNIKLLLSFCFSGYSHTPFSLLPASAGDDAGITWVSLCSGPGDSMQLRSQAPARTVLLAVWSSSPLEALLRAWRPPPAPVNPILQLNKPPGDMRL